VDDPIDEARISKWTRVLDDDEKSAVREKLGPLGRLFGYSMDDPLALDPLRSDGRLLIRGPDLSRRAESIDGLDLSTRPPVPRFERRYHPGELTLASVKQEPASDGWDEPAPGLAQRALLAARKVAPTRRRKRSSVRRPPAAPRD
jgi:hypothetical protein